MEASFSYTTPRPRTVTGYSDRIEVYDNAQGSIETDNPVAGAKCHQTWDGVTGISLYPFWRIAGVTGKEFAAHTETWLMYKQGQVVTALPSIV